MPTRCPLTPIQQVADVIRPSLPEWISLIASWKIVIDRCWVPSWTIRPYRRAASTMARPSATVGDAGFST